MVKERLLNLMQSGATLTAGASILATGGYVMYKDRTRYPRMHTAYARGNILAPLAKNDHEVAYFSRPEAESKLRHAMSPSLSNEYYLINGDVGTGKTRTCVEVVRDLMDTQGSKGLGAPIYVHAAQGKSFPDTLASAVNFSFDEHISFKFFLDFVLRIHSFPSRDTHHKLTRVLDAIEASGFQYLEANGRPVVLVIDGVNSLGTHEPEILSKLQEKAKLWADTNAVKVIFISNDEETEMLLLAHASNWSRAASPISVGDLSKEETIAFLTSAQYLENPGTCERASAITPMDHERAERIYSVVGGRMSLLVCCKRDWAYGVPLERTITQLQAKEREKFLNVSRSPSQWKVVEMIMASPKKHVRVRKLIEESSQEEVFTLLRNNIISLERKGSGIVCRMESRLTEYVVEHFYTKV